MEKELRKGGHKRLNDTNFVLFKAQTRQLGQNWGEVYITPNSKKVGILFKI